MPEPNLPPLKLVYDPAGTEDSKHVNLFHVRTRLKELPEVGRQRLVKSYGLKLETALLILV